MMTTNLFVIVNVKQLRTGGSFRISLPFFRTSWGAGVLNSAIFNQLGCWNTNNKHFPLSLQSGSTLSNFQDIRVGLNSETRYTTAKQSVLKETFI